MKHTVGEMRPISNSEEHLWNPEFYSVKNVCRILDLGKTTVFALIKSRKLSTTRYGRRRLVIRESLQAYIAELKAVGQSSAALASAEIGLRQGSDLRNQRVPISNLSIAEPLQTDSDVMPIPRPCADANGLERQDPGNAGFAQLY